MGGSRKPLPRTTGPYRVQSATKSTVTIGIDGIAIIVSPDRVIKKPRVPKNRDPAPGSDNTASQPEHYTQENVDGNKIVSPRPNDPEPKEYAADQNVGHRGTAT